MYETRLISRLSRNPSRVALLGLALPLLSFLQACAAPSFRGYQVQDPPEAFLFDADASPSVVVFPDREIMGQGGWWRMSSTNQEASLYITRFRGAATIEEVEAARDRYSTQVPEFGDREVISLQFLRIDGREAWGWEEHLRNEGELLATAYRTVILYDTMVVSLEFYSEIPEWMDPTRQKAALASFGFGKTRILWGWVLGAGLLLGGLLAVSLRHLIRRGRGPLAPTEYELASVRKDWSETEAPEGQDSL